MQDNIERCHTMASICGSDVDGGGQVKTNIALIRQYAKNVCAAYTGRSHENGPCTAIKEPTCQTHIK